MPDGIDFIASTKTTGTVASIVFNTSGLSGYDKFIIKLSARSASASTTQPFFIELNSANPDGVVLYTGSNVTDNTIGDDYYWMPAAQAGAQAFGDGEIEILDPFSTDTIKIVLARGFGGTTQNGATYLWMAGADTTGTGRIDEIKFTASGDIAINTRISLYGIISASGIGSVTTA